MSNLPGILSLGSDCIAFLWAELRLLLKEAVKGWFVEQILKAKCVHLRVIQY